MTQLNVFVAVRDVNDNPPVFPFEVKRKEVPEVSAGEGVSGGLGLGSRESKAQARPAPLRPRTPG